MVFLPLYRCKTVAIAQQGQNDYGPEFYFITVQKNSNYAFKKATLIHAWGPVMTLSMAEANVTCKVLVLPKELIW
jgi:hypothetical protein